MQSSTNSRQILSNLYATFPLIKPFLNGNKFVTSALFSDVLESAVEHAIACGDRSFVDKALSLAYGTSHYQDAVEWVSERAGLIASTKNGQLAFEKITSPNDSLVCFVEYVASKRAHGVKQSPQISSAGDHRAPPSPKKKKPKRVDMLDSWARLDGCYEAGKKR